MLQVTTDILGKVFPKNNSTRTAPKQAYGSSPQKEFIYELIQEDVFA